MMTRYGMTREAVQTATPAKLEPGIPGALQAAGSTPVNAPQPLPKPGAASLEGREPRRRQDFEKT